MLDDDDDHDAVVENDDDAVVEDDNDAVVEEDNDAVVNDVAHICKTVFPSVEC